VCHSPVVLAMVSCEEAIMYSVSQLFQRAGNGLAKALLITKFVNQLLVLISIKHGNGYVAGRTLVALNSNAR
jgi:hypothetical protein